MGTIALLLKLPFVLGVTISFVLVGHHSLQKI
jgi:hypothetical protein